MTQTKNSRQQLKDQDDLSPGQQQSEWMAWPLNDQLVGWSNERLGCIDSTQATQVWWVLICFPGFLMTEWLQLKSEERSFLSCRKESDKDRQTGRSSQHVFCSIGQFSMSSSVGKKGAGWMRNQLKYSWKITGWKHKKIYNHILYYILDSAHVVSDFKKIVIEWHSIVALRQVLAADEMLFGNSVWYVVSHVGQCCVASEIEAFQQFTNWELRKG